ncbi:MauE/DoxX family redox-associated membrane protein [uncultured Chitinophaga sp.]|jgi:Methylamine utilisation protein MauE.|uniref:MauE/DoxX family redox-associated membrane protein n=1 Tax=uncultured Chitinophaga sp. TaxID=339340 RepID=UPI0026329B8B|nr:MauE/DoxX family redox-associated membrane protein [uncultured Chitinophaga sp.]
MYRKLIVEIIGGLFILLFLYTALSKLSEIALFRLVLRSSPLISGYANLVSVLIPVSQILVSLLLFIPGTRRKGLYAAFMLMLIFTSYLAYMLCFTSPLPCSCGGVISRFTWKQHLVFNIAFTLLALGGILLSREPRRSSLSIQ